VDEGGEEIAIPHHDVIPQDPREIVRSKGETGPEVPEQVQDRMDPGGLAHSVDCRHHLTVDR
jgi:hypothetical protein